MEPLTAAEEAIYVEGCTCNVERFGMCDKCLRYHDMNIEHYFKTMDLDLQLLLALETDDMRYRSGCYDNQLEVENTLWQKYVQDEIKEREERELLKITHPSYANAIGNAIMPIVDCSKFRLMQIAESAMNMDSKQGGR